jgi:hypothetical protein
MTCLCSWIRPLMLPPNEAKALKKLFVLTENASTVRICWLAAEAFVPSAKGAVGIAPLRMWWPGVVGISCQLNRSKGIE